MNRDNKTSKYFINIGVKNVKNAMDFAAKVTGVLKRNNQYDFEAYGFTMSALEFTLSELDEHRHISGGELLDGIRRYALNEYGPMARIVLESWGINNTMDFGNIVFNLIEAKLLSRRPQDSKVEFLDVYDFKKAFDEPYRRSYAPEMDYGVSKKKKK